LLIPSLREPRYSQSLERLEKQLDMTCLERDRQIGHLRLSEDRLQLSSRLRGHAERVSVKSECLEAWPGQHARSEQAPQDDQGTPGTVDHNSGPEH
jgi:hypothetical protein